MMRQSSGGNRRSRGWKVKHVLQICVLVAVCVWLVYQVKHSHDKKKALEERSSKLSDRVEEVQQDGAGFLKLGRKDPHGTAVMITTDDTTHNEEGENKEAEEAAEHEKKLEENEEEGMGTGGNEIEESNRERAEEEAGGGEEFGDEQAKEGRSGDPGSSDNQDNEGADGNSQEAREEHYKADDVSSAVARDTQEVYHENENIGTVNFEEHKKETEQEELETGGITNVTEDASKDSEVHDFPVDGESQQYNSTSFMETYAVEREPEVGNLSNATVALESAGQIEYSNTTSDSNNQMEKNESTIFESIDQNEQQNDSTRIVPDEQGETQPMSGGVNAETVDSIPENATVDMGSSQDQNIVNETRSLREDNPFSENNPTTSEPNDRIEQQNNSTESAPYEQVETRTLSGGVNTEAVDSTPESVVVDMGSAQDQTTMNVTTTLIEDNSNSENIPPGQTNKSDLTGDVDGSEKSPHTSSSADENGDAVQGDTTSSSSNAVSVTEEGELDSWTDLSTLPEADTKAVEGVAAAE